MNLCGINPDCARGPAPFGFIRDAYSADILAAVENEHPQVIALVMSYMDPSKAAAILEGLSPELQSDAIRRVAAMGNADAEIVKGVEKLLDAKLCDCRDNLRAGGVSAAVEILNLAGGGAEHRIINEIEKKHGELALELKKRLVIFEDILSFDDASVVKILGEADFDDLVKAFIGAGKIVCDKVFSNMPKRALKTLKKEMQRAGSVYLKDAEEARQNIARVICRLKSAGELAPAIDKSR